MPKLIKYILWAVVVLSLSLLLFINRGLADLGDWIYPGSGLVVHAVLACVELAALLWLWRGTFGRQKHLLLLYDDSPQALQRFSEELIRRMNNNPLVRKANISQPQSNDPQAWKQYTDTCLALLKDTADAEIRQTAKRIFLATALIQNGRLDALIVFVSLCRLVWRVSAVYNQRPHPREILSLYWAVATSAFLAFSIEELDLSTEITIGFGEAFQAMAPASVTAGVPFAGKALQTFTSATVDGAANCYLILRAGIITRNAYAYSAKAAKRPSRAEVFKEAGAILLSMSQALVDQLASALTGNLVSATKYAARYAGETTVQAGKNIAQGIGKVGQGIGVSAEKIASGTVHAAQCTGSSLGRAGSYTGATIASAAEQLASGTVTAVRQGGNELAKAGTATAKTAVKLAEDTGEALKDTGTTLVDVGKAGAGTLFSVVDAGADLTRRLIRLPFGGLHKKKPQKPDRPKKPK